MIGEDDAEEEGEEDKDGVGTEDHVKKHKK